jgi:hypothetical protein
MHPCRARITQIIIEKLGISEPLKVALAETLSSTYILPTPIGYAGTTYPCRSCGRVAFGTDTTLNQYKLVKFFCPQNLEAMWWNHLDASPTTGKIPRREWRAGSRIYVGVYMHVSPALTIWYMKKYSLTPRLSTLGTGMDLDQLLMRIWRPRSTSTPLSKQSIPGESLNSVNAHSRLYTTVLS